MSLEIPIGAPSPEEITLMMLRDRQVGAVAAKLFDELGRGETPRIMSVVRPDLLIDLSEELWPLVSSARDTTPEEASTYKTHLFDQQVTRSIEGSPEAISSLPKFATSFARAAFAIELLLDNREVVTDWREGRSYIQFIGSFNPQHVGHRASIASTLEVSGSDSSALVQVVENHPIKKDSLPPYRTRFDPGEQRLYTSRLLDIERVTQLDVPVGLGLAKKGAEQIKLLADITGDIPRWQIGSDKFMSDVHNVKKQKALDKAGVRFSDVHLYVARRDTEDAAELNTAIDYVRDRFDATVTLVPESPVPLVLSAAASKIRSFRASNKDEEADRMEFSDLRNI